MTQPIVSFNLSKGGIETPFQVIARLQPNSQIKANELIVEVNKHGKQIAELLVTTDSAGHLLVYSSAGNNPDEYRITIHPEQHRAAAVQIHPPDA